MFCQLVMAICLPLLSSCNLGVLDGGVFEYRAVHLPENLRGECEDLKLDNVDNDWGLWGHNLGAVLTGKVPDRVYALHDGFRDKDQFCFSSEDLYHFIEQYVIDNYGERGGTRFAILPSDNSIVCQCSTCQRLGNTPKDATPAVCYMVGRLCERFPKHYFFTSYYSTTRNLPEKPLPANGGVLVSAMDYPLGAIDNKIEAGFIELLRLWSAKSEHVYVWDYINNFDDYFTPFPQISIMQHRLSKYADAGVAGVFLNGSGPEYCTMSGMKCYILAQLLRDPRQEWTKLLDDYCAKYYPTTGDIIASFIRKQEAWTEQRRKVLPIYGGITSALNTYLPEDDFVDFHNKLLLLLPQTLNDEHKRVANLCNAMAFTRLELMRQNAQTADARHMLQKLSECPKQGLKVYSESCWTVESYIDDYTFMLSHSDRIKTANLMLGCPIQALSPLDEEYTDLSILTDGLIGLPSNYHCGHMISSEGKMLRLAFTPPPGMRMVRVCLSRNVLFRLDFPSRVNLIVGGRSVAHAVPQPLNSALSLAFVDLPIPAGTKGQVELQLVRDDESVRGFAVDEIEGFTQITRVPRQGMY